MYRDLYPRWRREKERGAHRVAHVPAFLVLACLTLGCHGFQILWVSQFVLRQAHREAALAGIDIPDPSQARVLLYEYELGPGWKATSANLSEWGIEESLVCESRCWLFFVDFIPKAHFAHPTAIALYDLERNRVDLRLASWWPALERPQDQSVTSIFSTFEQRDSQGKLAHPLRSDGTMPSVPEPIPERIPRRLFWVSPLSVPPVLEESDAEDQSATWALLVQGYSDLTDTFSSDVSRSAMVMDGLRVPSTNIKIVQPLAPADTGPSCISRINDSVSALLGDMQGKECDEFLLYFSSHGNGDAVSGGLQCSYNIYDPVQFLAGTQLAEMLKYLGPDSNLHPGDPVECDKVTVVIQSCFSGSFISDVNIGLTGVDHVIVTSSDVDQVSYTDIDDDDVAGINDDNEGDVGTEFSSGFWEAYGRETADGIDASIKDLDVDLAEAFIYAKQHDVTNSKYGTNPQWVVVPATGLDPKTLLRTKENIAVDDHAALEITSVSIDNLSEVAGTIVKDDTNTISVDIHNTSNHYVPVLTVRVILKAPASVAGREVGRTEIQAGLWANGDVRSDVSSTVEWRLKESYPIADTVDICVVADSPAVGAGNAAEICLYGVPVVPNPNPPPNPGPCLLGCTH